MHTVVLSMVATLLPALALAAAPSAAAAEPDHVNLSFDGCTNDGSITLPNANGDFICPDAAYAGGNLGPGWNELDLVPFRLTATTGSPAPANQTYTIAVTVDALSNGTPGYDFLSAPVLNTALSSASCSSPTVGAQQTTGTTDVTRYRLVTITQARNTTCVYDYFARLAIGSSDFPGASLHAHLANENLGASGVGSQDASIPVDAIAPQDLDKDMTATQDSDHVWSVVKSPTPASITFADTCNTGGSLSQTVSIRVSWTKLPASPSGDITVVTHVYATNPASRVITVDVSDQLYSGTLPLGAPATAQQDLLADTANQLVLTHTTTVPAGTTLLNDIATGTYTDKATGVPIPGTTTATASATVQASGVEKNQTATITDVESIVGSFSFSVDSFTGASGAFDGGYVPGTLTTGPVSWTSASQSGSGSVTLNKTVYALAALVSSGTNLSDVATLTGSDGFLTSANLNVALTANASTTLAVSKTTSLALSSQQTFTFHLFDAATDVATGATATATIPPLGNGPVTSTAITGLSPTGSYYFKEDANAPYAAQQTPPVTFALVLGDATTCSATVSVSNNAAPATAQVRKITAPTSSGNWTFTLTGPNGVNEPLTVTANAGYVAFASALDVDGGTYTITETQQVGYDNTTIVGDVNAAANRVTTGTLSCSFTLNLATDSGGVFECTFTNVQRGTIIVQKVTDPVGAPGSFTFSGNAAGTIAGGGNITVTSLAPGTYTSTEANPAPGFDLTDISCNDASSLTPSTFNVGTRTATFKLDPGETVTCTFTNRQRGNVRVVKTVGGSPLTGSQAWTFQLREGASAAASGTILETLTANAGNGGTINFTTNLVPGNTYQMCEQLMPGWMTSLGPPIFSVYNPSGDNSVVCTNFTVTAGQLKVFGIDNTAPPGGRALTIGFWKNWASCAASNGKQKAVLDQALLAAAQAGAPITLGQLVLNPLTLGATTACRYAVAILNKSTLTGKKMSSDPLFNMAAQLLAADLNVAAGAGTCASAVSAISAGHALLTTYSFNGNTYSPKLSKADVTAANTLATTLDLYNNNKLC